MFARVHTGVPSRTSLLAGCCTLLPIWSFLPEGGTLLPFPVCDEIYTPCEWKTDTNENISFPCTTCLVGKNLIAKLNILKHFLSWFQLSSLLDLSLQPQLPPGGTAVIPSSGADRSRFPAQQTSTGHLGRTSRKSTKLGDSVNTVRMSETRPLSSLCTLVSGITFFYFALKSMSTTVGSDHHHFHSHRPVAVLKQWQPPPMLFQLRVLKIQLYHLRSQ